MKSIAILLILQSLVFTGHSLEAQQMGKAPSFRTTTSWTLQIEEDGLSNEDEVKVRVLKDTLIKGKNGWLLEASISREGRNESYAWFLVDKENLNLLFWKQNAVNDWSEFGAPVFQFPLKTGRVYEVEFMASESLIYLEGDKQARIKVSSRGSWEGAPALPGGADVVTWTLNCMISQNDEPKFIFPVHYMEPNEVAGFPGSCPVQLFFEILTGAMSGVMANVGFQVKTVDWTW